MFSRIGLRAVPSSLRHVERLSKPGVYKPRIDFMRSQYERAQRRLVSGEINENAPSGERSRYDLKTFTEEARACGRDYYPVSPAFNNPEVQIDPFSPPYLAAAYQLYKKASQGTDLGITILGNLPLKEKQEDGTVIHLPSDEKYPSIDSVMRENLGVIDEIDPKRTGSTLWALKWSILVNDAWILGGNHAKTEFHFASPLRWSNFWNSKDGRMAVVARETIMITQSGGYDLWKPHLKLEPVAVCVDEKKAERASLLLYKQVVKEYWEPEALRSFFETLPKDVRE